MVRKTVFDQYTKLKYPPQDQLVVPNKTVKDREVTKPVEATSANDKKSIAESMGYNDDLGDPITPQVQYYAVPPPVPTPPVPIPPPKPYEPMDPGTNKQRKPT